MGYCLAAPPRASLRWRSRSRRLRASAAHVWTVNEYAKIRRDLEERARFPLRWKSPLWCASALERYFYPIIVRGCGSEATNGRKVFFSELVDHPSERVTAQFHGLYGHSALWEHPEPVTENDAWHQTLECVAPALVIVDMPLDEVLGQLHEMPPWLIEAWWLCVRQQRRQQRHFFFA
jgi:hypothetical protein